MPCYTSSRIALALKAENFDILEDALREMGYTPQRVGDSISFYGAYGPVTIRAGQIEVHPRETDLVNKINQGYSKQVIFRVAKKKKLKVRQTGHNQFVVSRR